MTAIIATLNKPTHWTIHLRQFFWYPDTDEISADAEPGSTLCIPPESFPGNDESIWLHEDFWHNEAIVLEFKTQWDAKKRLNEILSKSFEKRDSGWAILSESNEHISLYNKQQQDPVGREFKVIVEYRAQGRLR